jgi:hypothetical protein
VRSKRIARYVSWVFAPIGFFLVLDHGWLAYFLFFFGFLMIFAIAGAVAGAVFPLDVTCYEPTVTEIDLTR